ncbi:MAG: hypothetical protein JEZ09_17840 [Salinivirgaceae bacterium]|nr:hypothetical protein [Salinivirgaceae bacterium]
MLKKAKKTYGFIIAIAALISILIIAIRPNENTGFHNKPLTNNNSTADLIWNKFEIALEANQIDSLISYSLDTIKCSELQTQNPDSNEYYNARFIFENHIDQLKHLDILSTQERHIYMDDSIIRVIYPIKCMDAEEDRYDLIFMFVRVDDKYLFSGMILT